MSILNSSFFYIIFSRLYPSSFGPTSSPFLHRQKNCIRHFFTENIYIFKPTQPMHSLLRTSFYIFKPTQPSSDIFSSIGMTSNYAHMVLLGILFLKVLLTIYLNIYISITLNLSTWLYLVA